MQGKKGNSDVTYSVSINGDIEEGQYIIVAPDSSFILREKGGVKSNITAVNEFFK